MLRVIGDEEEGLDPPDPEREALVADVPEVLGARAGNEREQRELRRGETPDELLEEHDGADTLSTQKRDGSTANDRQQKVDHLDAGLQQRWTTGRRGRGEPVERRPHQRLGDRRVQRLAAPGGLPPPRPPRPRRPREGAPAAAPEGLAHL